MWKYEVDQRGGLYVVIPHWSLVLVFGAIASGLWPSWIKWRFSLRTLLIVTTLVAVGLGVAIAAM